MKRIAEGTGVNEHKMWLNAWDSRAMDLNSTAGEASIAEYAPLPPPARTRAPPAFSLDPGYARGTHRRASYGVAGYTPYSYSEW